MSGFRDIQGDQVMKQRPTGVYQVHAAGKPVLFPDRFLRGRNKFETFSLDYAYIMADRAKGVSVNRVSIFKVDENGKLILVKPLRHLMKGTLPKDVNFESSGIPAKATGG